VAKLSPSAFVAPTAVLVGDVSLAAGANVWYMAVLRGDMGPIVVNERSNIQDGVVVHADEGFPCLIGKQVVVGHGAVLHGCRIDDDSLVGIGALVLNGATVGAGSVIGAGALITEGSVIPPGSLVYGVPGRVTGLVDERLRGRIRNAWQGYLRLAEQYRAGGKT